MTLTNGHVTSPVEQPYYMKDSKSGMPYAVLDTTGTINTLDDAGPNVYILITDHKMWTRQNKTQAKETDLTPFKSFYIDKNKLTGWMGNFSHFASIAGLPLMVLGAVVIRLLQVLIYGAINLALSAGFGAQLIVCRRDALSGACNRSDHRARCDP